jgi:hypothetical protein
MLENQTANQKKIALAQSEHSNTIIELMKDCITKTDLIDDKSEWKTIVNTIRMDAEASMIRKMVDYLEDIRKGSLHEIEIK